MSIKELLLGVNLQRLHEFVRESNKIEGIVREPLGKEISAAQRFLELNTISLTDLKKLVKVFQPDARYRRKDDMVAVGGYVAPQAGRVLDHKLITLLEFCNSLKTKELEFHEISDAAYKVHCAYELMHPFTDGNGRSGRILWLWVWSLGKHIPNSFLQQFYYQALRDNQRFLY